MWVHVLQVLARKYGTSHNFRTTLFTGNENSIYIRNAFGFVWIVASLCFAFTLTHSAEGRRKHMNLRLRI